MLISACLIVKNEEALLPKTLPNLIAGLDEVIVLDTGSSDKTPEIARQLGAKVFDFAWISDFAAARNESLKKAQGDWILWVDADEYFKLEDIEKLKAALRQTGPEIAYLLKIAECKEGQFEAISFNYRPKVFRNHLGIHFERPINEQPFSSEGQLLTDQAKPLEVTLFHWGGHLSREKFLKKKERNIELLSIMADREPLDVGYRLLLGMNYQDLKQYDKAIPQYRELLKLDQSSRFALAARGELAWALWQTKQVQEAFNEAISALKLDEDYPVALNVVGAALFMTGKDEQAEKALLAAAQYQPKSSHLIVNLRQKEYIANLFLSALYLKQGQKEKARQAAEKAVKFDPTEEALAALKKTAI